MDFLDALTTFFFPANCLHCEERLPKAELFLCPGCSSALPWLEASSRCPRCFLESCSCSTFTGPLSRRLAVFSHFGPAFSLVQHFKFAGREEMASVMASLMLVQLEKAGMPWPDYIVPVPHAPWHALLRGYHPTDLIARALAKRMHVKVAKVLKRHWTSLPQHSKTKGQRILTPQPMFSLRGASLMADRTILLIDDVTTTGETLQQCSRVLQQSFPSSIYACTLTLVE
ncbi:MAG: ComF family protein [Simkania sp.]|nr:ComF family protein [Simkania sp.]